METIISLLLVALLAPLGAISGGGLKAIGDRVILTVAGKPLLVRSLDTIIVGLIIGYLLFGLSPALLIFSAAAFWAGELSDPGAPALGAIQDGTPYRYQKAWWKPFRLGSPYQELALRGAVYFYPFLLLAAWIPQSLLVALIIVTYPLIPFLLDKFGVVKIWHVSEWLRYPALALALLAAQVFV